MRIERIELDGFGRFREERWDLGEGASVLLGENEAGKTTLLNAVRALLFGFEPTRDGRTWYPALSGGRRGGRLILRTAADERWVVERHGERGGGGSLAVRAPNGNQGGQETLDRLLRGADRDLFNNIFAFGLGELQTFASLNAEGVRGRIYGAGAGLGGTSSVDLERGLRQQMELIYLPRGQRPLNSLLGRIEENRQRIAELERQPLEFEQAHRERAAERGRAESLRASVHELRERSARLGRLRAAAPIAAELALVAGELDAGDESLDAVPPDAVAVLDRLLGRVGEATATLDTIDEELREAHATRDAIDVDERLLALGPELQALGEERMRRAEGETRRADLRAARDRHAAAVAEQLARAGGWEESRLLAVDDSIIAVEATRTHDRSLLAAASAAEEADRRRAAAADELATREREATVPRFEDGELERKVAAIRSLDEDRVRRAAAAASGGRGTLSAPVSRPVALAAAVAAVVIGAAIGISSGAPLPGVLVGAALALAVLALSRDGGHPVEDLATPDSERDALLDTLGLPPGASDEDVRNAADEVAAMRARTRLASELAASLSARRSELERLDRAAEAASSAAAEARGAWDEWLAAAGLPGGLTPEAARAVLGAVGVARRAAEERDREAAALAALERAEAEFVERADSLLTRAGAGPASSAAQRDALVLDLVSRLEVARAGERRCRELDATIERLDRRRVPAAEAVAERQAALDMHVAALGCADPDALRRRGADAERRRALLGSARELRARLAGIAGSVEAIDALVAEASGRDPAAVEAEQAEVEDELARLEGEERDALNAIGALDARIRELETADELGLRRQELAGVEGQAADLAREWAVRAIALRLLEETRARYERERQPDVVRAAEAHFARITDGRYTRILAPPGEATVRVETEGGEVRATDELSRGTAEQLYLALRFGLIEEFARHAEPLPVVMDDILVNFDSGRAARAAAAIRDLAERHQVLYFTCHRWIAELLDPSGARTVELEAAAATIA